MQAAVQYAVGCGRSASWLLPGARINNYQHIKGQ